MRLGTIVYIWDTFDLVGPNLTCPLSFWGHFGAFVLKCNSKTAGRRAKWNEIWDSVTLVTNTWGAFDLVGFKVILKSFGALFSKYLVTQIWLAVERKGLKFRTQGH